MRVCDLPLRAFVDPGYPNWLHRGIPTRLLQELEEVYGPELQLLPWDTPISELFDDGFERGRYNTYLTEAIASTHNPNLGYHGMPHSQRVCDHGEEAEEPFQQTLGVFPGEFMQGALYALAVHDKGHTGSTFLAEALPGRLPIDEDVDPETTTLEAYTAKLADQMARNRGFSLLTRLLINYIVISSAFGAAHPVYGKRLRLHLVQPRAIWGAFMRAADIIPVADFTTAINDETSLLYLEIPAFPRPLSWQEYLNSRDGFLSYVTAMLNLLDESFRPWLPGDQTYPFSEVLGWRHNLDRSRRNLQRIKDGTAPAKIASLRARLRVLGVTIT